MVHSVKRLLVLGVLLSCSVTAGAQQDKKKAAPTDSVVDIDGLKSKAPVEWKREKPSNLLRSYQFRIPKTEGDKDDAELGILPNITGEDEDNVVRYQNTFLKEGREAKVERFTVGKLKLTYVDVAGTYLKKQRPIDPDSKAVPTPNYRMFAVLFVTPENTHRIMAVGPARTMGQQKKAFDDWLKAFKADGK